MVLREVGKQGSQMLSSMHTLMLDVCMLPSVGAALCTHSKPLLLQETALFDVTTFFMPFSIHLLLLDGQLYS